VTHADPHHQPPVDITVWLDREAAKCASREHGNDSKAARLHEAAALIRKQRADLVAVRLGQRPVRGA
jgi:hypothetical protein